MRDGYDLVVVGAGPAGGVAAREAASRGLRTLLVEEHPAVGCPGHCTGKLSVHAFREFALPPRFARNALSAGRFHGPQGAVVDLHRSAPDSYIVDRAEFDAYLAEEAQRAGAEVLVSTRLHTATRDRGGYLLAGERGGEAVALRAEAVISAEGARPALARTVGLGVRRRPIRGLQYDLVGVEMAEDTPEVFFGHRWTPGFFAWLMPLGSGVVRIGLAVDPLAADRPPSHYLERFMAQHPAVAARVRGARVVNRLAGFIPILDPASPSARDGFFLAGDAAGHVKATSGGGIYFAMVGARFAARAAAERVSGQPGAEHRYRRAWRRAFGRELVFTGFARRILNRLPDGQLDRLLATLAVDAPLRSTVERVGDTAWQSRLALPLLAHLARTSVRDPSMAPLVARALVSGFAGD